MNQNVHQEPGQTGGPGAVDAGGLISEAVAAQMQHAAVTEPPSAVIAAPDMPAAIAQPPAPLVGFSRVSASVMFTFNLSNQLLRDKKDVLADVDLGDGEHSNLYSPMRKSKKKGVEFPAPDGVLRDVLPEVFALTDALNNSKIVYAGDSENIQNSMSSVVSATCSRLENLLPLEGNVVVAKVLIENDEDEDEGEDEDEASGDEGTAAATTAQDILFRDLVRVESWLSAEHDGGLVAQHNATFNFIINSCALYDSQDPAKYIESIITVLNLMHDNRGEAANTDVLLGISLDPAMLSDAVTRSFFNDLLDSGFTLYTKTELTTRNMGDWLPNSAADVNRALMSSGAELLLVRLCNGAEEEEEAGAE